MSKTRIVLWGLATVVGLLAVIIVAGLLILRSQRFHDYVQARIIQEAEQDTGGRVELQGFDFHWPTLRADFYGLAIHGTEPEPSQPLLQAERLSLGLKIISILQRKISLTDLEVDRPVVHLLVDAAGKTNIPQPRPPSNNGQSVNVFDLAIRHTTLNRGEVFYNDRKLDLAADLHDLQAELKYEVLRTAYDGSLRYRNARVQFGSYEPLEHSIDASFRATPDHLQVDHLQVATPLSQFNLQGSVENYSSPAFEGQFRVQLATAEASNILKTTSLTAGTINTEGSIKYQYSATTPFLEAVSVDGNFESSALAIRQPQLTAEARSVRGQYRLEHGTLTTDHVQADLLNGHITAGAQLAGLSHVPQGHVQLSFSGLSLNAASRALASKPLQGMPLDGSISGTAAADWRGSFQNVRAGSDATIQAEAGRTKSAAQAVPVNGVLHLSYDAARNTVAFENSFLRTPATEISFNGVAGKNSSMQVSIRSNDLREVDLLANEFRAASPSPQGLSAPLGLQGAATLTGQIQGIPSALQFTGQFSAENLKVRQTELRSLRAGIVLSPAGVALHTASLVTTAGSRIDFDVTAGLHNWSHSSNEPIRIQAITDGFPLDDLQHLAGTSYPVQGVLSMRVDVSGSQLEPQGKGSIALTQARLWNQPVQRLSADFDGQRQLVRSNFQVQTPGGTATGSLSYNPQNQQYDAQLQARNVRLEQLEVVRTENLDITGTVSLTGSGRGSIQDPQFEGDLQMPQLHVQQQTISHTVAHVTVAQHRAAVTISSNLEGTAFRADANVQLAGDYPAEATLDAPSIPLQLLLAKYMPQISDAFSGETEVHAKLKGPLKHWEQIEAQVEIPKLAAAYQSIQIQNANPIRLEYHDGMAVLEPVELTGTGTDVHVQATIPVRSGGLQNLRIDGAMNGTLDLRSIQIFRPDIDSSGQIKLNVRAQGTLAQPQLEGQVQFVNGNLLPAEAPLGLENLNGELALHNTRLDIVKLSGESGGGQVSAQGSITLQQAPRFDLNLSASSVRLRYPTGMRAVLDSQLNLSGDTNSAFLRGQVLIDRLSFTDKFDLANFMDQFRGDSVSTVTNEGFLDHTQLDVAVQSTDALNLESSKFSVQGTSNLRVRGTLDNPVILGRANITEGEMFFMGNRYEIQNGVVNFANPLRTEPVVNIAVNTTISQYDINVTFRGPVDRMETTYNSTPPLPPVDIINLLAFGSTTSANTASPSLGAESLLASGLSSQVGTQVEHLTGISQLSIDPGLGGNQQNSGTRVVIQQRASSRLLFTLGIDLSSSQSDVVQLEYQVTKGWSVSAVRDQYGGYGTEIKHRTTF